MARINFHKCIQDSQNFGSDDDHMVSRVFFSLEINGQNFKNLHADIKQLVGSDYESGPIEVGHPEGYEGHFNYQAFRDEVEMYYRSMVGSGGSGINFSEGTNIRMRNNQFTQEKIVEIEVGEEDNAS